MKTAPWRAHITGSVPVTQRDSSSGETRTRTLDVYCPEPATTLIVYVHGGDHTMPPGYQDGLKEMIRFFSNQVQAAKV
ncbi:MAG: hypothetical protein ACOC4I_01920 [Spirochaetota bacterium]